MDERAIRRFAALAVGAAVLICAGAIGAPSRAEELPELTYQVYLPGLSRGEPLPPQPPVFDGPVASIAVPSAGISASAPIEERDTHYVDGRELLEDPTHPAKIAWYPRFGHPGYRGANSLFAAHVNYVGYGNGPFAALTSASPGDALYVTLADASVYVYTVRRVEIIPLSELDMDDVVYPDLGDLVERVTLISCGGTFVPRPGGGGEYDSRVILIAERVVN